MSKDFVCNFIEQIFERSKHRELARELLKSKDDCNNFYINFLGRNRYLIDDLLDYRDSKL